MVSIWWTSWCYLDWEHEHSAWWQQEALSYEWWNHSDDWKHEHDLWAHGPRCRFSCHCLKMWYGLYGASLNGLEAYFQFLEEQTSYLLPWRSHKDYNRASWDCHSTLPWFCKRRKCGNHSNLRSKPSLKLLEDMERAIEGVWQRNFHYNSRQEVGSFCHWVLFHICLYLVIMREHQHWIQTSLWLAVQEDLQWRTRHNESQTTEENTS